MGGIKPIYKNKNPIKMSKYVLFLGLILGSIILSGAASAATVNNQINSAKIHNVGIPTFSDQTLPSIDGTRVVWQQKDLSGHSSIYYKNMAGGNAIKVLPSTQNQYNPSISGTRIVWVQENSNHKTNIYYKNMATGQAKVVLPSSLNQTSPDISGSLIVWETNSNGYSQISYKNMLTGANGKVKQFSTEDKQFNPAVAGNRVVWSEWVPLWPHSKYYGTQTVYVENLQTKAFGKVQKTNREQLNPDISGMRIVWNDYVNANSAGEYSSIYNKNLATGKSGYIGPSNSGAWNMLPAISGTRVVWVQENWDSVDSTQSIFVKNLATGKSGAVLSHLKYQYQTNPAISGTIIVWQQRISSKQNRIYYCKLSTGQTGKLT